MKKILVIGSSNTDMITRLPLLPTPGQTILGGSFTTAAGGKGANQAVAAARAGGDVTLVACLGEDAFADTTLEKLRDETLNIDHIKRSSSSASGVALIMVNELGENIIGVAPGANHDLTPTDILALDHLFIDCDLLLLQLEIPLETVEMAAKLARDHDCTVMLNPAPSQAIPSELMKQIDILTPNETETEKLSGIEVTGRASAEEAAAVLQARGAKNVIITMGKQGALLASPDQIQHVEGFDVTPVDTTAAGDTFIGALAVAMCEGQEMPDAIRFANAAAAVSITEVGAQPSIPNRERIDWMLSEQRA